MFEECCTLQDCEKLLAEELQHAELIGEVTISQEGLDDLIDFVDSEEFRFRDHPEEALARFPHVMAVLLVWIGVYDYEAGAYWPGVSRRLAIAQDAQSRAYLGGRFLAQLSLWGKPTFADIRGHVYVARILAHGGIPDTCLSDFFQHILLPVLRGRVSGVPVDPYDPDGVVQALDARYDSLTAVVDKPVLRFLLHGGPAARDFLLRCVDMAYTIVHSDELSSGAKFGLPPRVVTAFREWLNEENHERSPRSDAHRWRRPRITLNLQRRTIDLRLPEQWLPCEIFNHVSLVISHRGKHLRSERLPLFRQSGQVYSDEIAVTLPPSDEYTATIVLARHNSADNELRTWPRLEGMRSAKAGDSDEAPGGHSHWLVFDSDRLEVIRDDYLSKEELWLVAPADSSVPSIAEPHPLTGRWAEYAAFPVLPEGNTFEFELPDGSIVAIPVAKSARPRLEGEQVREVSCCGDPVYRAPPVLKLPDSSWGSRHLILRALAGQRLSPGRWPIEELQSARTDGGTLLIDLGAAGLLGDVRVGYYSLRIEGPLGEDFTCRFAIVRDITIQFEKPLYCPDAPEEPTRMRTGAQEGILVTEEGIEKADKAMTKASGRYNTRLQVSLVNGNEAETYEPVSLSCVPPRVRLHLAQDADSVPEVSTAPFTVGIQELRDNDLEMVVILSHVEGGVAELEFAGRTERTTIVGQQAAFRLGAFLEAIACASSDVVRGEVTVSGGTLACPICFPVMIVEKSWSIASPRCTLARKRGMERWYIRWHQSAAPENRVNGGVK